MSEVTHSIDLADLSLDQLVQLSQGIGRQIDALREQRAYLRAKINERIDNGERESVNAMAGSAEAPGALIEASVGGG